MKLHLKRKKKFILDRDHYNFKIAPLILYKWFLFLEPKYNMFQKQLYKLKHDFLTDLMFFSQEIFSVKSDLLFLAQKY